MNETHFSHLISFVQIQKAHDYTIVQDCTIDRLLKWELYLQADPHHKSLAQWWHSTRLSHTLVGLGIELSVSQHRGHTTSCLDTGCKWSSEEHINLCAEITQNTKPGTFTVLSLGAVYANLLLRNVDQLLAPFLVDSANKVRSKPSQSWIILHTMFVFSHIQISSTSIAQFAANSNKQRLPNNFPQQLYHGTCYCTVTSYMCLWQFPRCFTSIESCIIVCFTTYAKWKRLSSVF